MDITGLVDGLTVPAFIGVFGMGWGACYLYIVTPLKEQVAKLENRIDLLEKKFLDL